MPVYMGSQRIRELYVGGQRVKSAHMWNGTAWQRVHIMPVLTPSRVVKSGNQVVQQGNQPTGWVLSGGYQGSATTNGLLVVGAGTVNITAQARFAASGLNRTMKITRNGSQIGSGSASGSSNLVSASASSVTVGDGDVISFTHTVSATGDAWLTVVGGADTYIQITAA
ncbi:hypothetical protein GS532_21270 [Rhodococcus hoagii]|uniref:hypothetical protein n=1 Tax=Rhodococcus hoagii TaxID=43767 RepID=UPI00111C08BF|nr:hypothetical protein [Prescottella equi]MBM4686264.1 hypothetical protein [Prescottella equi]